MLLVPQAVQCYGVARPLPCSQSVNGCPSVPSAFIGASSRRLSAVGAPPVVPGASALKPALLRQDAGAVLPHVQPAPGVPSQCLMANSQSSGSAPPRLRPSPRRLHRSNLAATRPALALDGSAPLSVSPSPQLSSRHAACTTGAPSMQDPSPPPSPQGLLQHQPRHTCGDTHVTPLVEGPAQTTSPRRLQPTSNPSNAASSGECLKLPSPHPSPQLSCRRSLATPHLLPTSDGLAQPSLQASPKTTSHALSTSCLPSAQEATACDCTQQQSPHGSPLPSFRHTLSAVHLARPSEAPPTASPQHPMPKSYQRALSTSRISKEPEGVKTPVAQASPPVISRITWTQPQLASAWQYKLPRSQQPSPSPQRSRRIILGQPQYKGTVRYASPSPRQTPLVRMSSIPLLQRTSRESHATVHGASLIVPGTSLPTSPHQSPRTPHPVAPAYVSRLLSPQKLRRASYVWTPASTAVSNRLALPPQFRCNPHPPCGCSSHSNLSAALGSGGVQGQTSVSQGPSSSSRVSEELSEMIAARFRQQLSSEADVTMDPTLAFSMTSKAPPSTSVAYDWASDPTVQLPDQSQLHPGSSVRDSALLSRPDSVGSDAASCCEVPPRRRRWSNERCGSAVIAPSKAPHQGDEDTGDDELILSSTCLGLQQKLSVLHKEESLRGIPPLRL
mmetsp:Transcript_61548/g.170653  ORF Transcript_61548/g.170653 Transcript_61548/m.170653 type:complete len:672 (+) Transcript_61548:47-2062(+)